LSTEGKVRVEAIRVADLLTFIDEFSRTAQSQVTAPIDRFSAIAHTHNPAASDGDIGLLVAYAGDLCVGYQTLIPGVLRSPEGSSKVFWLSANYVLPEYRKRLVALQIVRKLASLKYDLVATNFTQAVWEIYRASLGFHELPSLPFRRLEFSSLDLLSYIPYRIQSRVVGTAVWNNLAGLSRQVWTAPARDLYYRLTPVVGKRPTQATWREVKQISRLPVKTGEAPADPKVYFERDLATINWMLKYLSLSQQTETYPPYFFARRGESLTYSAYELYRNSGEYCGFAILSARSGAKIPRISKVLDIRMAEPSDLRSVASLAWEHARKTRADRIIFPESLAAAMNELPLARVMVHQDARRYMYRPSSPASPLALAAPEVQLDLPDGDYSFS
jgi:hypothetical protein